MGSGPPLTPMRDPLLHHVFQPFVDGTGIQPRAASEQATTGFVLCAVVLSVMRVAVYGPDVNFTQAFHVAGAFMLAGWMRWCARNGAASRLGAVGVMHVVFRWVLVGCVLLDLIEMRSVAPTHELYPAGALLRVILATLEDGLGASALFLSACDRPPPRRRTAPAVA